MEAPATISPSYCKIGDLVVFYSLKNSREEVLKKIKNLNPKNAKIGNGMSTHTFKIIERIIELISMKELFIAPIKLKTISKSTAF